MARGGTPRALARALLPLARLIGRAPPRWVESIYTAAGVSESIRASRASQVRAEAISRRMIRDYPERRYPAVVLGASNGAAVHLAALLGAPILPQTSLVLLRHSGIDVDQPQSVLEWGRRPGREIAQANPELLVHQMHDPNQDRLMAGRVGYFRMKRRVLGATYERFLSERLQPGGALVVVDCRLRWPVTTVGERQYFQFGGVGGMGPGEYRTGGERVARFLEARGSASRRWHAPPPDTERAEAEWGFDPELMEDIERFAHRSGLRVIRLGFEHPEELSPLVADLYRGEYARRGLLANRMLIDSFSLVEPFWTLRTGSVPYWLSFNALGSAERVEAYLDHSDPFDEVNILLIQHAIESVGIAPIERWEAITERRRRPGRVLAIRSEHFPRDFQAYVGYQEALRGIPARYPLPASLPVARLESALRDRREARRDAAGARTVLPEVDVQGVRSWGRNRFRGSAFST